jgi:SAM-dependent methyltransferase
MACLLCDGVEIEPVRFKDRHGGPLRSVICRRCGLVWTDPQPTPAELRDFYAREYRLDYKGIYQPTPQHSYRSGKVALERFGRLRPYIAPGARVLDVGAGSGEVVYVLRAMGYDASGLEPNEGYARYGVQTLGLPIATGFYQDAEVAPAAMDAVTMFHTLEHLDDPLAVLRRVAGWLAPGGVLLVEVPNVEAVCQQPHQQFHRGHLFHFNLATLECLGRRAGLAVVHGASSADGGNIWVVFRETDEPPLASGAIPGNFARVRAVLRRHTALRHFFSRYPYVRPVAKLAARLEERMHASKRPGARAMLDALIEASLQPDGTPVVYKRPHRSAAR